MTPIANDTRVFKIAPELKTGDIRFPNRFGITLAGHLYLPSNFNPSQKYPAIAVSGPFGAVKEQSSGLYAQQLAQSGFVTLAFDPSFTGESSGEPRYVASPDINTEDFSAAVDYLSLLDYVDSESIGTLGICGWGGLALNAAANDPRIKATAAVTMYDISRVTANGYFDATDSNGRYELRQKLNAQRLIDAKNGKYELAGGVVDPLPSDAPQFVKDYHAYYKTPRGYHARSLNSNGGWNKTSALAFLNAPLLTYSNEIRSAVLLVHGENAHSRYFSETAFKKLQGENKELLIVPGANHVDLYDNFAKIPFDKITNFFQKNLKVKQNKILVAYYSYSGNTRFAAEQIQKLTGGELFEIKPVNAYPATYNDCVEQAKKEINAGIKPKLTEKVKDFNQYEVIFVGTPNWWSTMAPPVLSFLSDYDFSGKVVIPFVTHGGGGMANCEKDMQKACPKAHFGKGGAFPGKSIKSSESALAAWVNEVMTTQK